MVQFVAYVDEAGDEGLNKIKPIGQGGGQSQWLALGACIVNAENDKRLPRWRDDILARFPQTQKRDLHFRNLHHEQKVVACREIAARQIGICVVLSNKRSLQGPKLDLFKRKQHLYNYLVRLMLERISRACREASYNYYKETSTLKVVFSRRSGTDYDTMRDYFKLMRDGNQAFATPYRIDWDIFNINDIAVENHSKWAGLQIADVCTSAFTAAVEPNFYGETEPTYARILSPKLIRKHGAESPLDFGLTPIPPLTSSFHTEKQQQFFREMVGGGQAPGS